MNMELTIISEEGEAYQNFVDSIRDSETLRKYNGYLKYFLELIPNPMYKEYLGYEPKSRDVEDLANAFVGIALKDVKNAKGVVRAYVRESKSLYEKNELKPATLKNRIKPIKKLCKANDVEISWHLVDQSLPLPGKSGDRAYTRDELQNMVNSSVKLVDKVIITMSASGGFRVEAWNYFCWKDLIFFKNNNGTYKGAALLIYRGDIEEYVTCITPEACNYLQLYREEWKKRFLRYPEPDDPILVNVRNSRITRLGMNGVRRRMITIAETIGMRPPLTREKNRHDVMITHGFRKSWSTNMRRAKVDFADKEEMMGHTIAQEKSYQRYIEDDFEWFPEYQKAIPFLTISNEERIKAENQKLLGEKLTLDGKLNQDNQLLLKEIQEMKHDLIKVKKRQEMAEKYQKKNM